MSATKKKATPKNDNRCPKRSENERPDFATAVWPLREELYAHALRLTRNPSDAEDLVQDAFARACGAWERFEPGTNCRAWLFRILTNSFINGYRRKKRHRRFTHESGDDSTVALYGIREQEHRNACEALAEESLGDEVTKALDSLGHDYRQVVELADLGGHRYKDIAKKLGVPIGTVMSRLFRARRQLEALLAEYAAADYGIRRATA